MNLPITNPPTRDARWVIAATVTVVAVVCALLLLLRFYHALIALFVAILVSTALRPVGAWLERRLDNRMLAAVILHVGLVMFAAGFVVLALPLLIDQIGSLWGALPEHYANLRSELNAARSPALQSIGSALPGKLDMGGDKASIDSVSVAYDWARALGSPALTSIGVLALSFYWTLESEVTVKSLLLLVPLERRDAAEDLVGEASGKLAAYVRGQAILCAAVGVLAFIAYWIIGLPHAFSLALMAGLLEAIPLIGPVLGAIPAALVALAVDPILAAWVALATLVIQLAENYLLVPRIMDKSVGVNAFITILAIAAFGSALGIIGAILAIPIAALIQLVLDRYILGEDAAAPPQPRGRDHLSALRYETQTLAIDIRKLVRRKEEQAGASIDALEDEMEGIAADLDILLAREESEAEGLGDAPAENDRPRLP